ncbi:MAG: OmpA family protein [Candidatus Marinimicrobia bacterium]|nr:OmpA family protein [Candidatus Neomarinimicrobiota bacterium]
MQDDAGAQVSDSTTVVFFAVVVSGIVTDTDDNPVSNAVVIIVQGDETIGTDTTAADGQYEIPVYASGEYTIIIQFLDEFGTVQTITYNIEVTPGAGEMFEIPLTSVLSGRIVDAGTGQPILRSGIPVIITELDTTLFSKQTLTSLYRDTSYTDSSGFWSFSSLDLGTYKVETTPNLAGYYRTGTRSVTLSIPGQYILNANIALRQSTLQSYKTVDRPRAMSGDTLTYRIYYGTLEQTLTDTIRIVDQLPEELEWINISPEHASGLTFDAYYPMSHELCFYRAGMPAKQIDSILFRVRVKQNLASETATITNTAIVHTQNDTVSTNDDPRSDASTQLMSPFLAVEKTVNRRMIETGDILGYSVTLENRSNELSLNDLVITDILPPGFRYREGRSVLDGNTIDDPSVHTSNNAQVLTWNIPDTLQPGTSRELKYRVIAGLESRFGENVNRAFAEGSTADSYRISSNEASAEVILKPGMLHERGFIFGKVFYDLNLNNMHDQNEGTVKGVEIITEEGIRVVTDEYGKYSIPNVRSGSHVLRINRSTLPEGSSVRVSSSDFLGDNSSRLVKVSPSGIAKANFILGKPGMETAKPEDSVRRSRKLTAKKDTAFLNMELRSLRGSKRIMKYLPWQMDFYMHFEPGKNILAQEDKIMLRRIAKFLKWQDHLFLTINGHTDNIPTRFSPYSDNMALSLARAEAVLDYLKAQGIGEERMNAFGYGETRPKMSNATQAGRKANRRVELIFCQEERLNDASNDLQFRVDIDHSGTLPLKNVRLVSRAPEGFRFDGKMDDGFNVRAFLQKGDDHTGIWELGNGDKSAGYSLHYHAVPDNFDRIKTQSSVNAYLEFELPDGTKERTGILANKLHTQVEEVFFKLDLESAMFDIGSAALKPAAKFELDKLGECLVWQDQLKICVEGFTDNSGSAQLNAILSLNRAEAVKTYLSENYDIASERIQTIGYGKDFPVADNGTAEGRERNRRIEIIMKPEFIRETDPVRVISKDRLYYHVEGMTTGHTNNNKNSARKKKR